MLHTDMAHRPPPADTRRLRGWSGGQYQSSIIYDTLATDKPKMSHARRSNLEDRTIDESQFITFDCTFKM
ncbi:hypothetical protein EVAR_49027_1 [Eumeta japonica]|uniref:Uncharacterized protein n=1 Tax=Eumeta variegata TaxID=151549 RepID=A0A4C1XSR5_EUMVA|nr:hypothetical protein EVAR_49027_1 [Eumeta japonica]